MSSERDIVQAGLASFWSALWLGATVKRALKVAFWIGGVLVIINQGDRIVLGDWPPLWKIALTYAVPYFVSSYSTAALIADQNANSDT